MISVSVAVMLTGLTLAASGWAVEEGRKLSCEPDIVVRNDEIRVWFQGLKGHIKVFDQDEEAGAQPIYTYNKVGLVEVRGDEVVAEMDLSRALPADSLCAIFERDNGTEFVYHVFTEVEDADGRSLGKAGATFLYWLGDDDKGAKFDLLVRGWPWVGNDTELAFDFKVHSPFGMDTAENGIGFRERDGEKYGYMDWADTAEVVYDDDREDEARVLAEIENATNNVDVRLRYTGVEAGHVELDYDPWAGVGGYEIIDGRIYGDDWLDRNVPGPLRPVYQSASGLLP